jgi:hypothetical protein
MKTTLLILCCLALGACSKGVFSDASIKYGNPETGKWETIPAVVYVKKGEIKAVIVDR